MFTFPDVSLVRERSSPATYLVVGDTRFWITSPAEFEALGFLWETVRLVEDGTVSGLREGRLHAAPAVRPSDVFFDCGPDRKDFFGSWTFNCKSGACIVRRDILVAGWLEARFDETSSPFVHRVEEGIEDIYFNIVLDARFLDRLYGPGGLSNALMGATYPGNPPAALPVPFPSLPPTASNPSPTVTFDSWVLPQQGWNLHVELNAWHRDDTGLPFSRHFIGRGAPPEFWISPFPDDPGAFFPFQPLDPDGTGPLHVGDYVLIRGTLWQDLFHYDHPSDPRGPFDSGAFAGHGGWLEMHPPDWVVRVGAAPGPNARKTCKWWARMTADRTGAGESFVDQVVPDFVPTSQSRYLEVRDVQINTDARFTLASSVKALQATNRMDHVDIVATTAPTGFEKGRIKCSWVVDWRELDRNDQAWINDGLPAGAVLAGDREGWDWTADAPKPFFGALFHRSALVANDLHQHYFHGASQVLLVGPQDVLFAMVYLDPDSPPEQIMLQWQVNDWEHRAYWGENRIAWGQDGTVSRRRMGPLPRSSEWVRLEVPAAAVGLANATVRGMAFALWDGRAFWDYAGKCVVQPRLSVTVRPAVVKAGDDEVVTVHATDAATGVQIDGSVKAGGRSVGQTNTPFTMTFQTIGRVSLAISCPGYPVVQASINVSRN